MQGREGLDERRAWWDGYCDTCRRRPAVLRDVYSLETTCEPCLIASIERAALTRDFRQLLPPEPFIEEREQGRRRRRPGLSDAAIADRTPEKWLAEQHGADTSDPDWDIPW